MKGGLFVRQGKAEVKPVKLSSLWKSEYLKLALIGALGIALLLAGSFFNRPAAADTGAETAGTLAEQEEAVSKQVEEAVSAIRGAGKVQAVVKLEMGPESIYARSVTKSSTSQTETTGTGETREDVTQNETSQPVTGRFGTTESPLVEKMAPARIGGCLVIAEGATSSQVKLEIYRAVETLLGVPLYKIEVVPMKGGN